MQVFCLSEGTMEVLQLSTTHLKWTEVQRENNFLSTDVPEGALCESSQTSA